jgi:nicotinate-nucleotide pyrophosphorylase (carboxylating)
MNKDLAEDFRELLRLALREDLGGEGDVTSRAIFTDEQGLARLVAKQDGILAGGPFFKEVFATLNPALTVTLLMDEGSPLARGDVVAEVSGPVVSILEGERTAINFISFLSGIATVTGECTAAARLTGEAVLLDTRKTLPGFRRLSKYAVTLGGGRNHRMGLFDMVLIKDNHVDAAGGITRAVEKIRARWSDRFSIEVECRTLGEVKEAVSLGVDIIMLDNMTPEQTTEALAAGKGSGILFESSGNMDLEKIGKYSGLGMDFISSGMLTHSVRAFDFSLQMSRNHGKD